MSRNMLKLPPFFKQQFGVPFGDTPNGIRYVSDGRSFYVDNRHADTSDAHDGTDPNHPLETIGEAVSRLLRDNGGMNGDEILIAAGVGYAESVEIDGNDDYASNCRIKGLGVNQYAVEWMSDGAANPCLVLGQAGWDISGIKFFGPTGVAALIVSESAAPYLGDGSFATIHNNYFFGHNAGLMGLDFHGAPHGVEVYDNDFAFWNNVGNDALAIGGTNVITTNPYYCKILRNHFFENDGHVDVTFNVSIIKDNTFSEGGAVPAVGAMLDLRGGTLGDNLVVGNYFRGDYSNVGGYYANAVNPGMWVGNLAEDTAEGEVEASGWTNAPPA